MILRQIQTGQCTERHTGCWIKKIETNVNCFFVFFDVMGKII